MCDFRETDNALMNTIHVGFEICPATSLFGERGYLLTRGGGERPFSAITFFISSLR